LAAEIIENAKKQHRKILMEHESKSICLSYGIPVTNFKVAFSADEAVKFAQEIGFPVVLKILSPDIIHKSDVGGVMLNLKSVDDVEKGYSAIIESVRRNVPNANILGVTVQEMVPPSTEVIVGAIKDPQFGPVLMFGLGGVFVEVLQDVTFRVAPIKEKDAEEMVKEIKAYPLLKGFRGSPPANIDSIIRILVNTSKLVTENEEIAELDLNPIMVNEKGAKVVDARIILE